MKGTMTAVTTGVSGSGQKGFPEGVQFKMHAMPVRGKEPKIRLGILY